LSDHASPRALAAPRYAAAVAAVLAGGGLAAVVLVASGLSWWAALAGGAALALLAACLASPVFGLCATAFCLILASPNVYTLVVNTLQLHLYPYVFPLVFTFLGMLVRAAQGRLSLRPRSAFLPVLLLVFVAETASLLWTPHMAWGLANIARLVTNLLLYWCVVTLIDTPRRLDILFKTLFASAVMTAAGVLGALEWEYVLHVPLDRQMRLVFEIYFYTTRAGGIESWNQSAGFLSVASIIAAGYAVLARTMLRRALWWLTAMFYFCMMLLPASRGALLGYCGAAVLLILALPATRRVLLRKTTLFVVLVIVGMLVTTPGYIDRMLVGFGYTGELLFSKKKSSTSSSSDATGISTRVKIWRKGFQAVGESGGTVLGGLGTGGFMYRIKVFEVHNVYLAFYYDMGLAGIFLLFFLGFILVRRTFPIAMAYHARLARPPTAPDPAGPASADFVLVMFFAVLTAFMAEVAIHGLVDYDLTSFVSRYAFFYLALYDIVLGLAEARPSAPLDAVPAKA